MLRSGITLIASAVLLAGCMSETSTIREATAPEASSLVARRAAAVEPVTPVSPDDESFVYPFPDRNNPFSRPPLPQSANNSHGKAKTPIVQIRGFVDVVRLRAVLVDDKGRAFRLGVGDSKYNIEVVRIDPPQVELLRDGELMTLELSKP